jgi:hypothetical protein
MSKRLAAAVFLLFTSISCLGQAVPAAGKGNKIPLNLSLGGGMDFFSGDWGHADINRWGPTAWLTTNMWHCLGIQAEGHSMIVGGNSHASNYKLFIGEGGLVCTMGYWGRLQPIYKGQLGYASFTHPDNGTGHFHDDYWTWSVGGGIEYHIAGHWWARADYTYEGIPDFHSSISGQNHTLNPRGISFGATYRFGPQGTRF